MSALWEPVYGGSVLHSWDFLGGRKWATRCGINKPLGKRRWGDAFAKKCPKCVKLEKEYQARERER